MLAYKRRSFVKTFFLSPFFLYLAGETSKASGHGARSNLNKELIRAYVEWEKRYTQTPFEYLASKKLTSAYSTREISVQRKNDFVIGNTIEIEGLVLSKTETALILSLYFG